ncbi:MAG: T9SS type A sorting domain-containing protein [Ignavibacteriales bacterium]|nr:T9SS type A sorting domain-containing protein [Ignavibacteriales bacterium]
MKRVNQFLFLSVLFFLISSKILFAQETPSSSEFPFGVFSHIGNQQEVDLLQQAGMNYIVDGVNDLTQNLSVNLMGVKEDSPQDYITYYSKGYYNKWEAERDTFFFLETGFKHSHNGSTYLYGHVEEYLGADCWVTDDGINFQVNDVLWGPNYHQDKNYVFNWDTNKIDYTAAYRIAFNNIAQNIDTSSVCRLKVTYTYKWTNGVEEGTVTIPLAERILKVSDFPTDSFYTFPLTYHLPDGYLPNATGKFPEENIQQGDTIFYDDYILQGVEFKLDWFGIGKLYTDYVEVYDNEVWKNGFMTGDPIITEQTIQNIKTYAQNHSNIQNLKYWYVNDEPNSIDTYIPMRIVDSLVSSVGGSPTITEIYPHWRGYLNGDEHLKRFVNVSNTKQLMIDKYPFWVDYPTSETFEGLRSSFQFAWQAQPDFWYVGQTFSEKIDGITDCIWRRPTPVELNASVMLALAHGAKGIMFWHYLPNWSNTVDVYCDPYNSVFFDAILDENSNPTELYYYIKDDLSPRINGTLGSTLLNIDYTGDYLPLKRFIDPTYLPPAHFDYLTMQFYGTGDCNFHTGFLENTYQPDNKYFLTANILTTSAKNVNISVTKTNENFINYRFRNVESQFDYDTTFNSSLNIDYDFPSGEGYLFQVAPVVLYGGRLLYNETVTNGMTLLDDMTIENEATLTVTGTYNANANITVKDGGSIKTVDGGEIKFAAGRKLIIEGLATVKGTSTDELTLDFVAPGDGNGVFVKANADFTLSNCIVKNAETGVEVLPNSIPPIVENININNTSFVNCIQGITVTGSVVVDLKIKQCSITNSQTAVSLTNLNKGTIQSNFISNSECGIILNQSSNINVVGNSISSSQNEMPGIEMISSGGTIRANTISGHSTGMVLGSSSPKIGDNTITGNLINGIYVGANSNPDLRAMLGGNPPNLYPVSGHNEIFSNGGYNALGTNEDDGSEIYLSITGKIKLADGCNQIMDDRLPDFAFLDTTFTLMNGDTTTQVKADTNYWGTTNGGDPAGRFGILNVQYLSYLTEPCVIPQGGGLMMITQTASGEVIDTVYSTGEVASEVEQIDLLYAQADELYLTAKFSEAIVLYNQLITDYPDDSRSLYAYMALYKINKTQNADSTSLNNLREFYNERLTQITDTTLIRTIRHLSNLCLVGVEKYNEAINEFDEIVQNNPDTNEAFFAEIDALTTSYLLSLSGQTLGKTANTNYLVKSSSDYHSMLNNKMKQKFGKPTVPEEEKIIPEQYFLYQNYPNPFNPTTSIKFDLPQAGNVELTVYDILGRKVKQLLNETKPAGTYEVTFNASKLASGVYIYSIKSNDFTASKKLMLLK